MSRPITGSTAYVGRYADGDKGSWPMWIVLVIMFLGPLVLAVAPRPRSRRNR